MSDYYTRNIKECIIPSNSDEKIFICCDFSQLEIGGLAELSGDKILIDELNQGVDIHSSNAAMWKKKPIAEVLDKERKHAKVMTFQLQYGAGAPKMAETLDIPVAEATNFINNFYGKYTGVCKYHSRLEQEKKSYGNPADINDRLNLYAATTNHPMGRYYSIKAKEYNGRLYFPLTEIKNYPIQGFATGDLVPLVVNRIMFACDNIHLFRDGKSITTQGNIPRLVSTVHDDFTLEVKSNDLYIVLAIIEEVFKDLPVYFKKLFDYDLKVRYNYDVKVGSNFSKMEKITRKEVQNILKEVFN